MKSNLFAILSISFSVYGTPLLAHEGHDKVPGSVKAPHGGYVQVGQNIALEMVQGDKAIKIYPITHESKIIPLKDITIKNAKVKTRKMKIAEAVKLESAADYFIAKFDPKGEHRFELSIEAAYQGKTDAIKFQIEPQE